MCVGSSPTRSKDETEGLGVNCILFLYYCPLSCVTRDLGGSPPVTQQNAFLPLLPGGRGFWRHD